jgi:1-acyl-sn-glycerol-3-phosphate acyltransferase
MNASTAVSSAEPLVGRVQAPGWRAPLRLLGLGLWTAFCLPFYMAGMTVLVLAPGTRGRWRRWSVRTWCLGTARLVGLKVATSGRAPAPPFLLVSNHLSYLDVILLGTQTSGRFIAKKEVSRWPIWGPLARLAGTIFVDREDGRDAVRVAGLIEQAWDEGDGVLFFPEGTSTAGDRVLPFKPALLEAAARREWPVRYASLSYQVPTGEEPASRSVCWWGDMTLGPHLIGLCRLSACTGFITFGAEPIQSADRKELARRLHQNVLGIFNPVSSQDYQ